VISGIHGKTSGKSKLKGAFDMTIEVKIAKGKINYTSKKDGSAKTAECIVVEFDNGKTINLFADRFNYRTFDYLNDLLDEKI
jgi:hypothetical protein